MVLNKRKVSCKRFRFQTRSHQEYKSNESAYDILVILNPSLNII